MCSHFNVPINYAPNPNLAFWANQQRSNYRNQVHGKKTSKSVREHNQKLTDIGFNFLVDPDKDSSSRKRKGSARANEEAVGNDEAISEARKPAAKKSKSSDDTSNAIDEDAPLPPLHDDGGLQDALLPPLYDGVLQDDSIDAHDDIAVFADI